MAVKKNKKETDVEDNNESSTGSKQSLKESLKALQLVKNRLKKIFLKTLNRQFSMTNLN